MIRSDLLQKQIQAQVFKEPRITAHVDKQMNIFFDRAKKTMLAEFDLHPVTRDLNNEMNSGILSKGSLFGFLGFLDGDSPAEELRNFLEKSCKIRIATNSKQKALRTYAVDLPEKEDIYKATPLPWAPGRSWVKSIEHGISGIGKYLDISSDASRSGEGIQAKADTGGVFRNTSYISTILNNFKKKLLGANFSI